MHSTSHQFKDNVAKALVDPNLQQALHHVRTKFIDKRQDAINALPEFEALRDAARDLKNHVLSRLDQYLVQFEENVTRHGGKVHWAQTPDEARQVILDICRKAGARTVTKGKTMVGEEIAINDHLAANGIEPIETDLGEYIIQLRGETPSHVIAPAVHVTKAQVEETFRKVHTDLDPRRNLEEPATLLHEARVKLRGRFIAADVGITGANFLIAD
ncbi:MAG TPA: LUD domain-containing protein, partial [Alphaproteobacteria bacterium]|nr:LUD domain-containing protein [Alphaproteobacteria bacterium]